MNVLILVDVQSDFCPGGTLPVPGGHEIVPRINQLMPCFDLVVATQDWHPSEHASFAANHRGKAVGEKTNLDGLEQILWPVHCVQNTPGADLHPRLDRTRIDHQVRKGTESHIDSYSGFYDNGQRRSTGLGELLRRRGVTDVYLCGLATDYCVKYTALDAARLGFRTWLIRDAVRGIDLHPGDVDLALTEMQKHGVRVIESADILDGRCPPPPQSISQESTEA